VTGGDGFNLAAHVLAAGRARPDHSALVVPGRTSLTHGALLAAVEARAGGLAARRLPIGSRVLLRLGDGPDFPITYLAACAAGLVPVPSSAALTADEIARLAADLSPALTVADGTAPVPPGWVVAPRALDGPPLTWERWVRGDPERPGYVVFTSGSGGRSKAVVHAHRAILARGLMRTGWDGMGPDDRVLHAGAFNWTYTLGSGLMDPWSVGATAVVPPPGTESAALPGLAAEADATIIAAVPGLYRRMLRAGVKGWPRLRHGLSAGERLPPGTRAAWRAATGTDLHEALGMTECSTFVSSSPERPSPDGATGYPQPGRHVRIAEGRLQVRTDDPGLMLGYLDGGRLMPVTGDWFDTGDRVRAMPCGALIHEGRADDLLNPGGHRVAPQEVEAALSDLGVIDLAVGEVRLPGGATVLAAYWVGEVLDEAAADALAAARLASWKRPRMWLRREALPRNANGKLLRRALR
jgi:acyl-coenzyme A synthetase/AMP-(fatty) acid ligase